MRKAVIIGGIAVLCAVVAGLCGCGKKSGEEKATTLKLAHVLDMTHPTHKAMVFMAEKVKEKSGGRLRVDIYPSEQLGSEREGIEQLQIGGLAMTKTSSAVLEGFVPIIKVLSLPYLFRDTEHKLKVLNGPIGKELLAAGESVGFKGLCFYDAGARSFYTAKRPINTPEDLKGLKIRVQKSQMAMKMVQAMGAAATPIDWGELYTSLQQGVVDGAENNPPSFRTSMHYEVCKYYTLDEHTQQPDMILISKVVWDKLSPEFQRILQESIDESIPYYEKLWEQEVAESMKVVEQAGVKIVYPDKEPFRKAVEPLWAEFEGTDVGKIAERIKEVQ